MAKLVGRKVEVEEPHDFKGTNYVSIKVLSSYDDGTTYGKTHNFPAELVPDLSRKLAAVAKSM